MIERLGGGVLLLTLFLGLSGAPGGLAAAPADPSIEDFRWLEGHWRGEALGGVAEEVWLAPAGGAMVGTFRLAEEGAVRFYEIFTIAEPELDLRLKHFEADLAGWEEREEVVTFPFVRVSPTEAVFEGLVLRRMGPDRLKAVVQTESADGEEGELVFVYDRVEAPEEATGDAEAADTTAIEALIEEVEAANNAGDVERWVGFFAEDAVYMPPGVPAITTREGLVDVARAGFRHDAAIDVEPVEIEVWGDRAFARTRVTGTVTVEGSGEVIEIDTKQIVLYVRGDDGAWKISRMISNGNRP